MLEILRGCLCNVVAMIIYLFAFSKGSTFLATLEQLRISRTELTSFRQSFKTSPSSLNVLRISELLWTFEREKKV